MTNDPECMSTEYSSNTGMFLLQPDIEICTTMLVQKASHTIPFHGLSKDTIVYSLASWAVCIIIVLNRTILAELLWPFAGIFLSRKRLRTMFHHFHSPLLKEGLATTAMKAVSAIKPREGSVLSNRPTKIREIGPPPKECSNGFRLTGLRMKILQSHLGNQN